MEKTTKYYGVLLTEGHNPQHEIDAAQTALEDNYDIHVHTDANHFLTNDGSEYEWEFLKLETLPVSEEIKIVAVKKVNKYEYYIQRLGFEKVHGPYNRQELRVELFRTKYLPGYRDEMWKVQAILKRKIPA